MFGENWLFLIFCKVLSFHAKIVFAMGVAYSLSYKYVFNGINELVWWWARSCDISKHTLVHKFE
jgi:hypothetical protein